MLVTSVSRNLGGVGWGGGRGVAHLRAFCVVLCRLLSLLICPLYCHSCHTPMFACIILVFCIVLFVFTSRVPCYEIRYVFRIKTMFDLSLPLVVCTCLIAAICIIWV